LTHADTTPGEESESGSQDGLQSRPPRSIESGGSGTANNTLVSYHLETDLIDDDAIDDFPEGLNPDLPQIVGELLAPGSTEVLIKSPTVPPQSPFEEALETVSSEDDLSLSSSPKKVKLPPEPPGKCSAKLQEKFTKLYESKVKGHLNMNDVIQTKKMFRNPSIYEKLISHLDIDEFGTNYPEVSV